MLLLSFKDPQVAGPVLAAVVALIGVIITLVFKKKDKPAFRGKEKQYRQTSTLSRNTNQLQAGRDLHFNEESSE